MSKEKVECGYCKGKGFYLRKKPKEKGYPFTIRYFTKYMTYKEKLRLRNNIRKYYIDNSLGEDELFSNNYRVYWSYFNHLVHSGYGIRAAKALYAVAAESVSQQNYPLQLYYYHKRYGLK